MANKMNGSEPITAAWLAEGQSSQRDMLESLQALKAQSITPFTIIASHRHDRPEIFEFADTVFREPYKAATSKEISINPAPAERWQFVLEQAKKPCQSTADWPQ